MKIDFGDISITDVARAAAAINCRLVATTDGRVKFERRLRDINDPDAEERIDRVASAARLATAGGSDPAIENPRR